MSKHQKNQIILALTILLGGVIAFALRGLTGGLLGAIVVYALFRPMMIWLARKRKWNPVLATIVVLLTSFLSVILPIGGLVYMIITKIQQVIHDPTEVMAIVEKINQTAGKYFHDQELISKTITQGQQYLMVKFTDALGSTFDMLLQLAVMYFLLYFMFVHYDNFEKALVKYSPFTKRNTELFGTEILNSSKSNLLAQGFIALIQGSLQALGFYIFDLPDPVFWGVVTVFLSFLPVIGAPIVFIPASLYALSTGDTTAGVGMLIYGFVLVTNIDNVVRLLIARRISDTHPIVTVVGVIIGIPLFGFLGLVFGPLLFSFFILLVKIYREERTPGTETIKVPSVKTTSTGDKNNGKSTNP